MPENIQDTAPQGQPATQQPATQPSGGPADDNLMAALSYIWIVAVIMLVTKKDSDFVQFHAKQGLVLFIASVVLGILSFLLFFLAFIAWIGYLVIFVAAVLGFIKAYQGERYRLPVVADLADKLNF